MSAERVATIVPVLLDHRLTTPVQCACGWRETDPLCVGTWEGHVAVALDAALSDERGEADVAARVEAVLSYIDTWTPYESCDTGEVFLTESVQDAVADIRAALADPGALDRHDAEVKAAALREAARAAVSDSDDCIPWNHDHDRATVAVWLDERADRIEANREVTR